MTINQAFTNQRFAAPFFKSLLYFLVHVNNYGLQVTMVTVDGYSSQKEFVFTMLYLGLLQ